MYLLISLQRVVGENMIISGRYYNFLNFQCCIFFVNIVVFLLLLRDGLRDAVYNLKIQMKTAQR